MLALATIRKYPFPETLSFYGVWQFTTCLIAFIALMAIWFHIGRKQKDFGQVWLALSVLCWSFSGLAEVLIARELYPFFLLDIGVESETLREMTKAEIEQTKSRLYVLQFGFRSVFSLLNSLFILLALPWFRYIPKFLEPFIKSRFWPFLVGVPFLFSFFPTVMKIFTGKETWLISEFDVYFSILTLVLLGIVLWWSFAKRQMKVMAWISIILIVITFVAQLQKFSGSLEMILFSAIFKTTLIMIFFALALSWVKELAENVIPAAKVLMMNLYRVKTISGKFEQGVLIEGLPKHANERIKLSPASYELMNKFAERRTKNEGWLEIKPKNDPRGDMQYDIKDHNEIKRLVFALLDGIFGKGQWTKNQHLEPWKNTFFELSEKRERKIRLAIPPENIKVASLSVNLPSS